MNPQTWLVPASIAFAVLWTAFMIWWNGVNTVNIVMLSIIGALIGVAWFFAMRWCMRWWLRWIGGGL